LFLLSNQELSTKIWHVFMGMKSSTSNLAASTDKCRSLIFACALMSQ
jgi:hypothetical protein